MKEFSLKWQSESKLSLFQTNLTTNIVKIHTHSLLMTFLPSKYFVKSYFLKSIWRIIQRHNSAKTCGSPASWIVGTRVQRALSEFSIIWVGFQTGFYHHLAMWAFLAIFCLYSNFATSKMYISGNPGLQIAVNPYGILEIDKYHRNPSFLLGNLHLSWFATKFGPILSKYFWVKVCFSSKTLKRNIRLFIDSRRRRRKSPKRRNTFCNQS